MALHNLIARSGAENFETMRKGWLPTTEEKARSRLSELNVQQKEASIADASTISQQRNEQHRSKMTRSEQTTKMFEQKMRAFDTEEKVEKQQRDLNTTERFISGAFNRYQETGNVQEAIDIIGQNYDTLIEAGDDNADKMVKKLVDPTTDPKEAMSIIENMYALMPTAQSVLNKQRMSLSKKSGNTVIERFLAQSDMSEDDKQAVRDEYIAKSSGQTSKKQFNEKQTTKIEKTKEDRMLIMRKDATKSMKRITDRNDTITEALQSMEAGNNALSDKLLTSKLLNLSDTNVRALAIYKELDSSFGNLFERAVDIVGRVAFGKRNDRQNEIIKETLLKMKALSEPVMLKMRQNKRALAKADGHDPFRVVPPTSAKDIRDSQLIDREEKLKLFEQYPRFMSEIQ